MEHAIELYCTYFRAGNILNESALGRVISLYFLKFAIWKPIIGSINLQLRLKVLCLIVVMFSNKCYEKVATATLCICIRKEACRKAN